MHTFLRSFDLFSETEIDQIAASFKLKTIKKGDFFIQEGSICSKVAFIKTGLFRNFISSDEGEEVTYCIGFPNQLLTAYSSYITQTPTLENIQAITDAEILVISKETLAHIVKNSPNWLVFTKMMAEQEYIKLENRVFTLLKNKAKQRYSDLLTQNPDFVQYIPLQYLASYLGITQRHLSRLRRELVY